MNRRSLLKFSMINAVIGLLVLLVAYFCFHFVTDNGITLVWHAEAGKPFVTILIGIFGVLFIFAAAVSAIGALVFLPKQKTEKK